MQGLALCCSTATWACRRNAQNMRMLPSMLPSGALAVSVLLLLALRAVTLRSADFSRGALGPCRHCCYAGGSKDARGLERVAPLHRCFGTCVVPKAHYANTRRGELITSVSTEKVCVSSLAERVRGHAAASSVLDTWCVVTAPHINPALNVATKRAFLRQLGTATRRIRGSRLCWETGASSQQEKRLATGASGEGGLLNSQI